MLWGQTFLGVNNFGGSTFFWGSQINVGGKKKLDVKISGGPKNFKGLNIFRYQKLLGVNKFTGVKHFWINDF